MSGVVDWVLRLGGYYCGVGGRYYTFISILAFYNNTIVTVCEYLSECISSHTNNDLDDEVVQLGGWVLRLDGWYSWMGMYLGG